MLVLTFRVAGAPFAVAVGRVAEVVPRVPLRALPGAADGLAGLLHYRGRAVPVIDLGVRIAGVPCDDRLDTRIILVAAGGRAAGLLGLIAEGVEDVRAVDEAHAALPSSAAGGAAFLGAVYRVDGVLVQMIEPDRVLPGHGADSGDDSAAESALADGSEAS